MLLSSFFPEGIPFLNIEPNSLARNSIPPIPSLLEENGFSQKLLLSLVLVLRNPVPSFLISLYDARLVGLMLD
jgi:hypothetical protein